MKLHGLQKMTLLDFPGHVACTVFLGGCDFRCPYCHNFELADGTAKPVMEEEEFFSFLAKRKGLVIKWVECGDDGRITDESFNKALSSKTKLVSMTQVSNVLGTENDIKKYAAIAHEAGAVYKIGGKMVRIKRSIFEAYLRKIQADI